MPPSSLEAPSFFHGRRLGASRIFKESLVRGCYASRKHVGESSQKRLRRRELVRVAANRADDAAVS
jgi:hypothetical protein